MTNIEILQSYIPMVDFIADICGPCYEVVLHDISKPDASVIAIRNNHITGRKIGSPMTDLALKILKQKDYVDKTFITNYDGYGDDGKVFLSSTYFIKNAQKELIGMICVNNDITDIKKFNNSYEIILERFKYREENNKDDKYEENIKNSLISVANSIISKTINSINIPPSRMSIDEKVKIVHELNKEGVFLLKGAINEVAEQLEISEATVYRYLNKKI
ncbi:helix-turn-helix transcriptional regulator [Anaerosalibacter bizertensis]|uniref:helix-turn-helix transcriptional regulator n=1 Tax=Anaerosalibacter bizertensis TaxID=932217 RepID=UPI001D01346C|nr:PAS domain-containing protein [Anaerosalibacter bizertensis]MCB5560469.1 PAS domain-containing protein [Anaerosalibacter bizertensis]MCG4584097.1 PAS domain-containing protein [Anaerosalibacter bizertensis]